MRLAVTVPDVSRGRALASHLGDLDARLVRYGHVRIVEVETRPADAIAVAARLQAWVEEDEHLDDVVVEIDGESYTLDSRRSTCAET